jgi:hypothetical protein
MTQTLKIEGTEGTFAAVSNVHAADERESCRRHGAYERSADELEYAGARSCFAKDAAVDASGE